MPAIIRDKFIKGPQNEELIDIDLRNAHPFFLLSEFDKIILNNLNKIKNTYLYFRIIKKYKLETCKEADEKILQEINCEIEKYKKCVLSESGIYEYIKEKYMQKFHKRRRKITKNTIKKRFFSQFLFSNIKIDTRNWFEQQNDLYPKFYRKLSKYNQLIQQEFPYIFFFLNEYKRENGYEQIAIMLQKKESDIFVRKLSKKLNKLNLFYITIHDSVKIIKKDFDKVEEILKKIVNNYCNSLLNLSKESKREKIEDRELLKRKKYKPSSSIISYVSFLGFLMKRLEFLSLLYFF